MKELNNRNSRKKRKHWRKMDMKFENFFKTFRRKIKANVKENSFKISIHRTIKRKLHVFAETISNNQTIIKRRITSIASFKQTKIRRLQSKYFAIIFYVFFRLFCCSLQLVSLKNVYALFYFLFSSQQTRLEALLNIFTLHFLIPI